MKPFSRAALIAALIKDAMLIPGLHDRQAALQAIGPYKSRGKGRGGYQNSRRTVAQDKRDALKARNKRRNK